MPSACRLGDYCSGHSCFAPRQNIECSSNVYVNDLGWHRMGDAWSVHCCGDDCHAGILAKGSPTVYINDRQAGRITDPVSCGSSVVNGSSTVYCGD